MSLTVAKTHHRQLKLTPVTVSNQYLKVMQEITLNLRSLDNSSRKLICFCIICAQNLFSRKTRRALALLEEINESLTCTSLSNLGSVIDHVLRSLDNAAIILRSATYSGPSTPQRVQLQQQGTNKNMRGKMECQARSLFRTSKRKRLPPRITLK